MKVFLSWSGEPTHAAAQILRTWLPTVLPSVKPWLASEDIAKGTRWSPAIAKSLAESRFGVLCLDASNVVQPWINFEAGALSRSFPEERVAPLLFGISAKDVPLPLNQFQVTEFRKTDVKKLMKSLAAAAQVDNGSGWPKEFDHRWSDLADSIGNIQFPKGSSATKSRPRAKKTLPSPVALNSKERQLVQLMAQLPERDLFDSLTLDEVANELVIPTTRARHYLKHLSDLGLLKRSGSDWSLTSLGDEFAVKARLT